MQTCYWLKAILIINQDFDTIMSLTERNNALLAESSNSKSGFTCYCIS